MLLNRIEFAIVNNRLRDWSLRRFELPRLLAMGGRLDGGRALELGCGSGGALRAIRNQAGAAAVDGFDLDPRMIGLAKRRREVRSGGAGLWIGSATGIPVPDASYRAVFDFGVVHHIPRWREALAEVHRVLEPGGRFYAEEVLEPGVRQSRWFLDHPQEDRFDADDFAEALEASGLSLVSRRDMLGYFAWFVAERP